MAEEFDGVTPDIGAPDANNPQGTYLDEDAGIPGTPILAGWKNTIKAFMERLMIRTGKSYNGNPDESGAIAQIYDALDEVTTGDDSLIADWAAATFDQDDVTRFGGKQWFVGVLSTIETPGPNSEWAKSKTFDRYLELATEEGPKMGGVLPLDDIRDGDYAEYYREGKFDWNGGKWEAWAVHVDGGAHVSGTSDVAKLLALSKFESGVVFSDTAGTLTLKDYTGLTARAVDASLSGNILDTQLDAGQRITGSFEANIHSTASVSLFLNPVGIVSSIDNPVAQSDAQPGGATSANRRVNFDSSASASPNSAKTDDIETRMANIAKGVWKLICIVPEGTI